MFILVVVLTGGYYGVYTQSHLESLSGCSALYVVFVWVLSSSLLFIYTSQAQVESWLSVLGWSSCTVVRLLALLAADLVQFPVFCSVKPLQE